MTTWTFPGTSACDSGTYTCTNAHVWYSAGSRLYRCDPKTLKTEFIIDIGDSIRYLRAALQWDTPIVGTQGNRIWKWHNHQWVDCTDDPLPLPWVTHDATGRYTVYMGYSNVIAMYYMFVKCNSRAPERLEKLLGKEPAKQLSAHF